MVDALANCGAGCRVSNDHLQKAFNDTHEASIRHAKVEAPSKEANVGTPGQVSENCWPKGRNSGNGDNSF